MTHGTYGETVGCLTLESLLDYLNGHGGAAARAQQAAHLASGCNVCEANQRWLAEVAELAASDRSFDFPESALARAQAIFQPKPASVVSGLRQWLAELVFDSLLQPSLVGARDGLTIAPASRQMLFRAEAYDIDLRFEPAENSPNEEPAEALIGQVLCAAAQPQWMPQWMEDVAVRLWQHDELQAEARTNARGIFKFNGVKPGQYTLSVTVPIGEIRLEKLETARGV